MHNSYELSKEIKNDINTLKFNQLWEEFRIVKKLKLKKQSYRKLLNIFKNHIIPYFSNFLVIDITPNVYLKWVETIDNKCYSDSYKNIIGQALGSILDYAVKFYNLHTNVVSSIGNFKKPKIKITKSDVWPIEEYSKFIKSIDSDMYKLLFSVLFFTGIRIGECLALTWSDYDKKCLYINKTIAKEKDENGNYIINTPKTNSSIRIINLDVDTIKKLNIYHKKQKQLDGYDDKWFIFGGIKPISQSTVGRRKNMYCEKANVKKIRLHDFRHSHATLLGSYGVPMIAISQRLGHKDTTTTLNTYTHLLPRDENNVINVINSLKSNINSFE